MVIRTLGDAPVDATIPNTGGHHSARWLLSPVIREAVKDGLDELLYDYRSTPNADARAASWVWRNMFTTGDLDTKSKP